MSSSVQRQAINFSVLFTAACCAVPRLVGTQILVAPIVAPHRAPHRQNRLSGRDNTNAEDIAGATVDAVRACMGDGMSTYEDGVVSAANALATGCGVRIGMPAREAAVSLLNRQAR